MRWDLNKGHILGQNFLLAGPKNILEQLMRLEYICNFMSTAKFIKICLILFVVTAVVQGVSVQTFPQYVETGSTVFSGFSSLSCMYERQDITITLLTDKGNTAYNPIFSIQGLRMGQYQRMLTVRLFLTTHTSSTVTVGLDTKCSFRLAQITIRYVVIVPPLVGYVNLVYFTLDDAAGILLKDNTNKVTMNQALPLVANQTKSALFLMGFHIENRQASKTYIDLFCSETLDNIGVTVDVMTNSNNNFIYLYHISLVVITVNTNFTFQGFTGTFQVVNGLNNYAGGSQISSPVSTTTVYSNSTTFVGIRGFKNIENNLGLFFDFTISSTSISLQTSTFQSSINCFSITFISFVFSVSSCTGASPYMLNDTCYATCPSSFFANNATSTCDNCSSSCAACNLSNTSCTSCPDRFYLSNSTCISCPSQCLLCTSPTACSSCVSPPYIFSSGACLVDCSSINQCNLCILVGVNPQCTNCSANYRIDGGGCVGICGDGVVVTGQDCDDANSQDNDGCSSSCRQQSYFTCTSVTPGATSSCSLNGISLEYDHTVKVKTGNAFVSYFKVIPNIAIMQGIDWLSGISITSSAITPSSSSYDASAGKLSIVSSYISDISSQSPVIFSFNYAAMSFLLTTIPASAHSQLLVTQNNLALQYYPDGTYKLAAFIEYFSLLLAAIAWLMVFVGYACGKLIVLEHVAVMQVAYLCLQTVHDASPTFQGLRWLRLSAGNTMLSQSDYSIGVSRELKGAYYSLNMLESYNIAFVLVLLPMFIAGIGKILSVTACKSRTILQKLWPPLLAGMSLYGLVLTAYIVFSQLFFSFLYIGSGVGTVYMGLVVSFCQSLLMGVYCYYLNKMPEAFGDFKKKFEKYNICSYYYTFVVVERFLTAMLIILLRNTSFGLAVATLPLLAQLIFVAVRKPYVCGDNRRPIINLTFSILIMGSTLMANLSPSVSAVQTCMPIIICLLLTVGSCLNLYHLVCQIKEVYFTQPEGAKEKGQADVPQETGLGKPVIQGASGSILNRLFKYEQAETVDQKNRMQFQIFKQKIMNGADEITIDFNPKTLPAEENSIQREMLNYQWDHYPIVTSNKPILNHMRTKIKQHKMEQIQEDEY